MKKVFVFSVMLVLLLVLVATYVFAQNGPSVRWEYTALSSNRDYVSTNQVLQRANQLGTEGWELVTYDDSLTVWVFKRRLP